MLLLFSPSSDDARASSPIRAESEKESTILVTYAGNLLLFPHLSSALISTESDGAQNSAFAGFFSFGARKGDEKDNPKKYVGFTSSFGYRVIESSASARYTFLYESS